MTLVKKFWKILSFLQILQIVEFVLLSSLFAPNLHRESKLKNESTSFFNYTEKVYTQKTVILGRRQRQPKI